MENSENLQMLAGMVWGVVALVSGLYFVACYLLEILAQKLGEPRWMAWLPIVNGYLVFRLAGWSGWFWALIGGYILTGVMSAVSPGFALFLMIPVLIATLIISLMIWLKIAQRRGLSKIVGLLVVLPNLMPVVEVVLPTMGLLTIASWLVSLGAFAYIVFYDGGPEESPHLIGYLVTTCIAAAIGVPLMMLPGQIANDPELAEQFAELEAAMQGVENGADPGTSEEDLWVGWGIQEAIQEKLQVPGRSPRSSYRAPAHECPEGTRDAGARPPGGSHWWCETQLASTWVRHGPTRKWYDHGELESEGSYENGQEQGTWSRYWQTGGVKVRADFRDGQQHGWMRAWDKFGRLESKVYYEYGEPVESPASR